MPVLCVSNPDAPALVKALHLQNCVINKTNGDGACAIHSVFGEKHQGVFQKAGAIRFLRTMMGARADTFSINVGVPTIISELACVLWQELVQPCAARAAGLRDNRLAMRPEGSVVWAHMLRSNPALAQRCVDAAGSEHRAYEQFGVVRASIIKRICEGMCTPAGTLFCSPIAGAPGLVARV